MELVGITPLVLHNGHLADPDNELSKGIAAITAKRKKTEEDRKEIARIEWYGGLYIAPPHENIQGPVMPAANVRKCLNEAAKVKRWGRDVLRSLYPAELYVPIIYEGPRDIDELFKRQEFHYRTPVGIGASKTPRTRPIFHSWALYLTAEFVEEAMDWDSLIQVGELAGTIEGLGDNRVNGYGRFQFNATKI